VAASTPLVLVGTRLGPAARSARASPLRAVTLLAALAWATGSGATSCPLQASTAQTSVGASARVAAVAAVVALVGPVWAEDSAGSVGLAVGAGVEEGLAGVGACSCEGSHGSTTRRQRAVRFTAAVGAGGWEVHVTGERLRQKTAEQGRIGG
jgi:hypothetical protein